MTQQNPEPEPQTTEETKTQEPEYYHSINRYWRGPGSPTRRIHHKSKSCRIGGRIKKQNRLEGKREDTEPCHICCADEIVQEQDGQVE